MKKLLYLLLLAVLPLVSCDDHDDVQTSIYFHQLPQTAQDFVNTHFSGVEVSSVLKEKDGRVWEFMVYFVNGSWIEFDALGVWEIVTCYHTGVPNSVVPEKILTYFTDNYPTNKIVQIEQENNRYDVELDNGAEFWFDKSGNLIESDYN